MTPPDLSPAGLLAYLEAERDKYERQRLTAVDAMPEVANMFAEARDRYAALAAYLRETEATKQAAVDAACALCERVMVFTFGELAHQKIHDAIEVARQRAKEAP